MDPTRTFLLNEMASASNLNDFYLAFRALDRLNRLTQDDARMRASQGSFSPPVNPLVQPSRPSSEPEWPQEDFGDLPFDPRRGL